MPLKQLDSDSLVITVWWDGVLTHTTHAVLIAEWNCSFYTEADCCFSVACFETTMVSLCHKAEAASGSRCPIISGQVCHCNNITIKLVGNNGPIFLPQHAAMVRLWNRIVCFAPPAVGHLVHDGIVLGSAQQQSWVLLQPFCVWNLGL